MKTQTVKVANKEAFDARSVALCVQNAGRYQSEIHLADGVRRMNAKSLMGMMAFGTGLLDEIVVEANGPDEDEALSGMVSFFEGH